jgi:hypothetical protein
MTARTFRRACLPLKLLWVATLWLGGPSPTHAGPNAALQLEAAYLINFLKYVEWPASQRITTSICLFGRDTLGPSLSSQNDRMIGGKELRIRRVSGPDDLGDCQLVYIPDVEEARIGAVLRWTLGLHILTVSNAGNFARSGGDIELVRKGGRMQFIVNAETLSQHGLTAGSQMMRLAAWVIGGER